MRTVGDTNPISVIPHSSIVCQEVDLKKIKKSSLLRVKSRPEKNALAYAVALLLQVGEIGFFV